MEAGQEYVAMDTELGKHVEKIPLKSMDGQVSFNVFHIYHIFNVSFNLMNK